MVTKSLKPIHDAFLMMRFKTPTAHVFLSLALGATLMTSPSVLAAPEKTPNWVSFSQSAPYLPPEFLPSSQKAVASLPLPTRKKAEALLEELTRQTQNPAQLGHVKDLLTQSLPGFAPKDHHMSGPHPHRAAVERAIILVLHGLVYRLAGQIPSAKKPDETAQTFLRTLNALPLFEFDQASKVRLHIEAREAMGHTFYLGLVTAHPDLNP